ncbi:unnamed protein product [Prunus armeniaca]
MTVWRATNPDARDFLVDMGFANLCITKTSNLEQKIATTKINRDGYEIRYKKRGNISSKEERFSNIHFAFGCKVESNNENQTLPSKEKCELALEGAGSQEHSDKIAMLVDDEKLELRELQEWPNALGCSDHFTTNGDHACSLCNDFLAKFPPNSVKMKHPFYTQPWDSSPEIVKKLFKVDISSLTIDEFAHAFQDKVENQEPALGFWKGSLNPFTWTEILRQALVAAGFGSKQGAMRRDALSKEMSLMVKYGLRPGTLKGELFGVLLERGIHGLKDSELAKSLQISELNLSSGIEELDYSKKKVAESQLDTEDSRAVDDDLGDRGTCSNDDDSGCNSGNSKLKKLTYMKYGKSKDNVVIVYTKIDESHAREVWLLGLMEGEYSDLSIEEKLSAIVAPIDLLHACSSFRMEHGVEFITFCSHMAPGNIHNTRAATEGHSELKLIFQHFDNLSHAAFSFCCKAIDYRPSNLQQH